jgi:hypothetical protein
MSLTQHSICCRSQTSNATADRCSIATTTVNGSGQLHGPATMPSVNVPRRPFDRRLGEWQSSLDALRSYRQSNSDSPLVLP